MQAPSPSASTTSYGNLAHTFHSNGINWCATNNEGEMGPPSSANLAQNTSSGPTDGELELDLDKDSDFHQHAQFQPDHAAAFPFQCYCGHEFHQQRSYRAHILEGCCVHWRDIKIRGNIIICTCGVQFAQRGSLFRHLRTRQCRAYWPDGGRALVCLCGAKFNRRDNMVRHQKSPRCRQNCVRLGVTGNPKDSIPPIRKNKHKKYRATDALYFEKMAETPENGDDEACINRRWYEQFGNTTKGEKSNSTLLRESTIPPLDHKESECQVSLSPPGKSESPATPVEQLATPQPSGSCATLEMKTSLSTTNMLSVAALTGTTRKRKLSTLPGYQRLSGMAIQHQPGNGDTALPFRVQESKITTENDGAAVSKCPTEAVSAEAVVPAVTAAAPALPAYRQDTIADTPLEQQITFNDKPINESMDEPMDPQELHIPAKESSSPPPPVPPTVQPLVVQEVVKQEFDPIKQALEQLSQRINKVLDKFRVDEPTIAPLVTEAIAKIIDGFMVDSKVPKHRAALLCETISTGVSQILLAKLLEVSNKTFVQIAHRMDAAVYEELNEPLKNLV